MAGNIQQSWSSLLQAMQLPHHPTLISHGSPSLFPPMPVNPSKTKQQTKVVILWDKFSFLTDRFISWCKDYPCYDSPLSFVSWTYLFFSVITHPFHIISPLTTFVFIITSFHPILQTSMTHSHLLIWTSSRFHHIPPCSICFVILLELSESQVYKPSTCYVLS